MNANVLRVAALLLAWLSVSAVAAERPLQVEVLMFKQPGTPAAALWRESRPLPACHAVALRDGSGAESAFNDGSECVRKTGFDAAFGGFSAVASSALPAHAAKLETAGHAILVSRRWQQANANLSPVLLRGGKVVGERQELLGTLAMTNGKAGIEATLEFVLTRLDSENPQYVTLQETRVLKPGELHYFDHPLFGVLVLINQVP